MVDGSVEGDDHLLVRRECHAARQIPYRTEGGYEIGVGIVQPAVGTIVVVYAISIERGGYSYTEIRQGDGLRTVII